MLSVTGEMECKELNELKEYFKRETDMFQMEELMSKSYTPVSGFYPIQLEDYFTKTMNFESEDEFRFVFLPKDMPMFDTRVLCIPEILNTISNQ